MHLSLPAAAMGLCLAALAVGSGAPANAPRIAVDPAPAPAPAPDPAVSDAAARHAKRTACLKAAKAKKLSGADRNTFVKACLAAR